MKCAPDRVSVYRLCRTWHGYLSAAAFVWLLFFSVTGILLNHPTWLRGDRTAVASKPFQLPPRELALLKAQKEPGAALVHVMRGRLGLKGEINSSDIAERQLFVRMRGASGSSDLQLDLQSGQGSATTETFPVATLFKELHRGEQAGSVWRALIDTAGAMLVVASLAGLLIYFSMRLRLRIALILIVAGLAAMIVGIALFAY